MDNDPVADQSVADYSVGADRTITAYPHSGTDHRICSDGCPAADFNLRADHRTRLDGDTIFHARTGVDMRSGEVAGSG